MANQGNLQFAVSGALYVATKSVSSAFALHVECADCATITIEQKSDASATKYDVTDSYNLRAVLDYQYQGLIYPVDIKITATKPVTYANITEG